jgi:uncharacterized protein (DUF2267 family)
MEEVQRRGCFSTSDETQAVVANVLMAVAECMPKRELGTLAAKVPPELRVFLRRTHGEPDPHFDSQLFLGWVVSAIDTTGAMDMTDGGLDLYSAYSGDEAIRRSQCVFSVVKTLLDEKQREGFAGCLPDEVGSWFAEA